MEENKLVVRAHGIECEQYLGLLRDFNRNFVIADIKPRDSGEVTPDSILWEQVPFVIIGSEKNRKQIENEMMVVVGGVNRELFQSVTCSFKGIITDERNL